MNALPLIKTELAAALARGVRQCVVLGTPLLGDLLKSDSEEGFRVFRVAEQQLPAEAELRVAEPSQAEPLGATLERSDFDKQKAGLFIWLGGAAYRSMDAIINGLAFIASLPKGTSVVLDYAVERAGLQEMTQTALDGLASRIGLTGTTKYLIQPQAVTAMLRNLGFHDVVHLTHGQPSLAVSHLVTAVV